MPDPTRVLHVLHELQPSGAETNLAIAGPMWRQMGIEADLLATGPDLGPYAGRLRAAGFGIAHLPLLPFPAFAAGFVRLLRRGRYDAVHVHKETANAYVCSLARAAGVRVVVQSVHNVFRFEGAHRLERRVQRAWMRRLGVRMVAVSPDVQANELMRFANPSTVLDNWYDADRFTPSTLAEHRAAARQRLGVDGFVLASVANCWPAKNHSAIIDAMGHLAAEGVQYLHVGGGEGEAAEQARAQALGLGASVRFLGQLDDVLDVLAAADAYLMPSFVEGFGIAAIEAIAGGVPAVLADTPGLAAFRPLGIEAEWIPPTADGIVAAVRHLRALDPGDREARAARSAAIVRDVFGPRTPVSWLASVYRGEAPA